MEPAPRQTPLRTMDREGHSLIHRVGAPNGRAGDLYHGLIATPWPAFVATLIFLYFLINLFFACLYWLQPGCVRGSHDTFLDAFFFSVQTLATIGYGDLAPASIYANCIVSVEACTGTLGFALLAGLAFAKFSIPRARVLFSRSMVIHEQEGSRVLEFRLANARSNQIVDAKVKATLARNEVGKNGEFHRRLYPLPLKVSETPLFALSFLATHVIDTQSPLHAIASAADLDSCNCEIIVTLTGIDDALGQTVYARSAYALRDIRFHHQFVPTLQVQPDGSLELDLQRFHDTAMLPDVFV